MSCHHTDHFPAQTVVAIDATRRRATSPLSRASSSRDDRASHVTFGRVLVSSVLILLRASPSALSCRLTSDSKQSRRRERWAVRNATGVWPRPRLTAQRRAALRTAGCNRLLARRGDHATQNRGHQFNSPRVRRRGTVLADYLRGRTGAILPRLAICDALRRAEIG